MQSRRPIVETQPFQNSSSERRFFQTRLLAAGIDVTALKLTCSATPAQEQVGASESSKSHPQQNLLQRQLYALNDIVIRG